MASLCRRLLVSGRSFHKNWSKSLHHTILPSRHNIARNSSNLMCRNFSSTQPLAKKETVSIYFVTEDNEKLKAKATVGDNLLDVIIDNDLDIDGFGACEGTLACSTCHLIFTPAQFATIPEKATDEELDMLDLAYELEDTSRLGCQVLVRKDMDGWEINVPAGVADARDV